MRRVSVASLVALALALSLIGTMAVPVRAATITVTTFEDELDELIDDQSQPDGDCSLREAIEAANTNAAVDECTSGDTGHDTITVPAGTYTIAIDGDGEDNNQTGDLDIREAVTINGAGASTTIIDGDDIDRIFDVQGGEGATITGLTVQNGTSSNGGGVRADDGDVTIVDAVIRDSVSDGDRRGGGLYVHSSVSATLRRVTVSGNTAFEGGGIYNNSDGDDGQDGGTPGLLIEDSTISGNLAENREGGGHGGGIYNDDDASILRTTLSGNEAENDGGGVFNDSWDFDRSQSTGATLSLTDSTVAGNDAENGGGIFNYGGGVSMHGSTVSGNQASGDGGGIGSETVQLITQGEQDVLLVGFQSDAPGFFAVVNSTVSGNTADDDGGGIFVEGTLEALFTTVASNSAGDDGGGIWTQGHAGFYATLVANNGAAGDCFHNDTGVDTLGSNLDTDDTCDFDHPDDVPDANAKIDGLASNAPGGTQTHALQFDSPAVDAVEPASLGPDAQAEFLLVGTAVLPTCPATDQRGITRPQDGDSDGVPVCDIGAYELLPPTASITDVTVIEGDTGTVDAVFTVTLSRPSTGTVTFVFATANGTATVVTDYQAATGTVTFAPTDVSETITVKVVGDTIDEPNETFTVNLTAPAGATLADAQGTGLILDDEGPIVTPAPTPRSDTLGSTLPNTGTGGEGLGGWGTGVAIGLVVVSASVLIRNRRRQAVRTR